MSGNRGSKSIWKKFKKPEAEAKREESDRLYYRINRKTGRIETNLLEWERSWRNVKILKFPARYADELRAGVRVNYTRVYAVASHVPRSTYVVRGTDRDSKTLYAYESYVHVPTSV